MRKRMMDQRQAEPGQWFGAVVAGQQIDLANAHRDLRRIVVVAAQPCRIQPNHVDAKG